ncbi:hypothetical protein FYJ92_05090 [Pseudarthrobacter sp. NBSH8]|nr:hypothetical protein FYJ92_05090 [Pseudarthrobacter sp. NBSH8]
MRTANARRTELTAQANATAAAAAALRRRLTSRADLLTQPFPPLNPRDPAPSGGAPTVEG